MSTPPFVPPGAQYPDPQSYVPPAPTVTAQQAQQAAAESIAGQAATTAGGDAAEMAEAIRQQVTRDVLLPMEQRIQSMMGDWQRQTDAQAAQIKSLQAQLAGAQAVMGPPAIQKYATAVAERLQTAANASGLPGDHWAGILGTARTLVDETAHALESGDVSKLAPLAGKIETFATKTHARLSNVHIEHFPALLGDLAELGLAAEKMAAVVA